MNSIIRSHAVVHGTSVRMYVLDPHGYRRVYIVSESESTLKPLYICLWIQDEAHPGSPVNTLIWTTLIQDEAHPGTLIFGF